MIKEKDKNDHYNFINHGDVNYQKGMQEHLNTINKHTQLRDFKNSVGHVAYDERQVQKELAMEKMKKQAEMREEERERLREREQ